MQGLAQRAWGFGGLSSGRLAGESVAWPWTIRWGLVVVCGVVDVVDSRTECAWVNNNSGSQLPDEKEGAGRRDVQ